MARWAEEEARRRKLSGRYEDAQERAEMTLALDIDYHDIHNKQRA